MERGDHRLARTFADRALAMDPEMVAAKRILEALKGGVPKTPASELPDLPLLAAQRLEALGRRRAAAGDDEGVSARGGSKPGKRGKAAADSPGALSQLPTKSPAARQQAGREAAAAEAATAAEVAEAASRPQASPRPKAHQALGDRAHRNLLPEDLKTGRRAVDPFAAAESAAAIEAIDATEDVVIEEHVGRTGRAQRAPDRADDRPGEGREAVDARGEDEGVAMRLTQVTDAADLEAAEIDAEAARREEAELDENVFGVAELVAAEELGPAPIRRIDLDTLEADLRAAELRAAQREAADHGAGAGAAAGAGAGADEEAELMAAELASAELAAAERASEWIDEGAPEAATSRAGDGRREPIAPPAPPAAPAAPGEEPTEEDAEAAALSEAMAMLLGGEADASGNAGGPGTADEVAGETRGPARRPAHGRPPASGTGPPSSRNNPGAGRVPGKPGADGAQSEEPNPRATPEPRRKGLLRRFRGD